MNTATSRIRRPRSGTTRTTRRRTFGEGASTFRVVEENTKALADDDDVADAEESLADNVGKPVTAKDADDDTPTYTLGGNDKDMFRLRANNGQIEVGAQAMLDYEKKKQRYTVTVIADDGYGASNSKASITVTIHVTDLDEGPDDNGQSGL